jgi:primosomal protein N' (replication factor Y)
MASLVNLMVSGENELAVADAAGALAAWCAGLVASQQLAVDVRGPAPCALARIKLRWRWHVALRGESESLGRIVRYAVTRIPETRGVRVVIDRDPVTML